MRLKESFMKIIALEREIKGKTAADFKIYAKAEAQHVWNMVQRECIREIYFRSDKNRAVIILECKDIDEAKGQ